MPIQTNLEVLASVDIGHTQVQLITRNKIGRKNDYAKRVLEVTTESTKSFSRIDCHSMDEGKARFKSEVLRVINKQLKGVKHEEL